jgi:hypothetical protein
LRKSPDRTFGFNLSHAANFNFFDEKNISELLDITTMDRGVHIIRMQCVSSWISTQMRIRKSSLSRSQDLGRSRCFGGTGRTFSVSNYCGGRAMQ